MATIYQVAEKAGVSLSTVSRVLNGRKTVNEQLRQKVEQAVQELNYRPSSVARSLATSCTNSVGVLVPELHSVFFGELMQAVEMTLRAQNKHVIICAGHDDIEEERSAIDFLISRNCDALILYSDKIDDEEIRQLNDKRIPTALINRSVEGLQEHCFCLDNEQGGYLATRHLLDLGHRDIAYIAGPASKTDAQLRFKGHQKALAEAGIAFAEALYVEGDYHEQGGSKGLQTLLSRGVHFSALACGNDWMASGAMATARDLGMVLPQQLSIVGFDDIVIAQHLYPKLTSISNPVYDMGEMAAYFILNKVYGQNHPLTQEFSVALISRDSSQKSGA